MRIEIDIPYTQEEVGQIINAVDDRAEDYFDWVYKSHECDENFPEDCDEHIYPYEFGKRLEQASHFISQIYAKSHDETLTRKP